MHKEKLEQYISQRCIVNRSAIAGLTGKEATIKGVVGDNRKGYQFHVELDEPMSTIPNKLDYYLHPTLVTVLN